MFKGFDIVDGTHRKVREAMLSSLSVKLIITSLGMLLPLALLSACRTANLDSNWLNLNQ